MNKEAILRAKRNAFASSKYVEEQLQSAQESQKLIDHAPPSTKTNDTNNLESKTDQLLLQLTSKLTSHIQENLRIEQINSKLQEKDICENIVSRLDAFVSQELSSFQCPICFELMQPPDKAPMLLFPCGHTFCAICIESHTKQLRRTQAVKNELRISCPYCRHEVESKAVNRSLKELIQQFVSEKAKIERGDGRLDNLFVSQKQNSRVHSPENSNTKKDDDSSYLPISQQSTTSRQYLNQLKSCEMRFTILSNEMEEMLTEKHLIASRKQKIQFATDHLLEEKQKVEEKLVLLNEERELIDNHLHQQQKKFSEVSQQEFAVQNNMQILQSTLNQLQIEMDKLRLLVHGVRAVPKE